MKLSDLRINATAVERGTWVGDLPGLPGVRFRVRGAGNMDARRLRAKLNGDVPIKERRAGLEPETLDRVEAAVLLDTVLLDWSGIEGDDGKPLPYSRDKAAELLNDPNFATIRNAVAYASGLVAEEEDESQGEALGKSKKASAGS